MELDESERRYLLAGTVDAVIAVYDTERPTAVDPATGATRHGEEEGRMHTQTIFFFSKITKTRRWVPT